MTTSNAAAVDKTVEKTGVEKVSEKLAEKRRALGRGLESLLPGPRVVQPPPTLPQSARKDGAPARTDGGVAVAPSTAASVDALPGVVAELQAAAAGQSPDG